MLTPAQKMTDTNALAELARGRVLCDIFFGVRPPDDYKALTGSSLGRFVLVLVDAPADEKPAASGVIALLTDEPFCHGAAVIAVSPCRVVLLAERGRRGRQRYGNAAEFCGLVLAKLSAAAPGCVVEAAEGRGAGDLSHCYAGCCQAFVHREGGNALPAQPIKPVLAKAMDYISANYREQISLGDVAKCAFVSPCYMSRLFNRELGVSFIGYLSQLRMEKAKQLLRDSRVKVFEVSEMVGIADAHYFAKLFKRHVSMSPTEYRGSFSG